MIIIKKKISQQLIKFLFLILTVLALSIVLSFTVTKETLKTIANFKPSILIILCGIWLITITMDASAIFFFAKGTDSKISPLTAYQTIAMRVYFNLITPFNFGGQPFMIHYLGSKGVPTGKASSIVVTKFLTLTAFTQIGAIVSFLFFPNKISTNLILNRSFFITGVLGFIVIIVFVVSLLYPQILITLISKIGNILNYFHIIKNKRKFMYSVIHEAKIARQSFKKYFSKHIVSFLAGTLSNGLMYFTNLLSLWIVLKGLGLSGITLIDGLALSAMLLFLISYIPTPGASGFGEGVFLLIFAGSVPKNLWGIAIILWRVFYNYLTSILGAFISARYFLNLAMKKKDIKTE